MTDHQTETADALPPEILSQRHGQPIASPRTTDEIAAVARHAQANNLTLEIIGAGTKRTWGNPVAAALQLDTTRLNRVLEHPWQDLTCTVQAGCTWSTLQRTLAAHNQFVALDPLFPTRATVGGIVATNDSGALRHRYGSLRDLILGMTIVLADGTLARTGGKVVKNVAGYDLHKLMTGSFGTLGVIAEVTFRLHPLPLHTQTFTIAAPQAAQLAPLMAAIRESHLLTQALQLRGNAHGFHLDIQLNAQPAANQRDLLTAIAKAAGLSLTDSTNEVWQARELLFTNKGDFVVKIGMLPTDIAQIADDIVRLGGTVVAQSFGLIYAAFPNIKRDYLALGSLYAYTDTGSMTMLQIPPNPLEDPTPPWGPVQPLPLMREIKRQFDPERILNPGRFLRGI
jgi:glycolate oxidase FAD binding subunit